MEFAKLNASIRQPMGKGAARRLRISGRVPAVVYGKDAAPRTLAIVPAELQKALAGPLRINTPLSIHFEEAGKPADILALVKDHQYDPITRELLHVDFLCVSDEQAVEVWVPVERHGRSVGEQLGGILRMVRREVPVRCKAKDIPVAIHVDVTNLDTGTTFHVSDLTLPEGISINLPPNKAIITVSTLPAEETKTEEGAPAAVAPAAKK